MLHQSGAREAWRCSRAGIPEQCAAHCGRNSIRKFGIGGYAGKRAVRGLGGQPTGENGRLRVLVRETSDLHLPEKKER
jgi:hypothetical protein